MTQVNLAYAVLALDEHDDPPSPPAGAVEPHAAKGAGDEVVVHLDPDGTLVVEAPAEETFERLRDAAERVGDVTYVDEGSGLLQLMVRTHSGRWCYVTFSLQGRAAGTEVFASIEAIDAGPTPGLDAVLVLLAEALRATRW
jgi:hypothetical protein